MSRQRAPRGAWLRQAATAGVFLGLILAPAQRLALLAPDGVAAAGSATLPARYAAEDSYLRGGAAIAARLPGYSGSGYVSGFSRPEATLIAAVVAPADGSYTLTIRYQNLASAPATLSAAVNGLPIARLTFASTGSASGWHTETGRVPLRTGVNTLALAGSAQGLSLDTLSLNTAMHPAAYGATVPYSEYEAEDAATNGTLIGPDRVFGDLAAEASGRRAVTLRAIGQYVEFTLRQPANGMVLRYSIPDSANGHGLTAKLGLSVGGKRQPPLTVTSVYSYLYGSYPFSNNPAGQGGHHFFDEVHVLWPSTMPAGTRVRVQVESGDTAPSYTIDLADFERVPAPYAMPQGYLSATSFGADARGITDATDALQRALNAARAQHRGLYLPRGTYLVTGHLFLDQVTMRGAGPWYTVLRGAGVGLYGYYPPNSNQTYPANPGGETGPSTQVGVYDLAIQGETTDRVDSAQINGFGGAIGGGSIIQNVWIEHTKVGMWFDGPFSDLLVVGCRMRDLTADGLNLHDGIRNVTVEQTQVRNSGDDGLALWSDSDADAFDLFKNDTVQAPYLANNIAMYGGHQNGIVDNYLTDTLTQGGGINIGNRDYGSAVVPLSGTILVTGNVLVRTGQVDPNWGYGVGGIWFYAQTADITARVLVHDDEIDDSTQEAVQFTGNDAISNVSFDHLVIKGAATFAFQVQSDVSAAFSHVTASRLGVAGVYNCGNAFKAAQGPGNSGWSKTVCDDLQSLAG